MKFTTYPNKSYTNDIARLYSAILNRENISFSKFCDGEWAVMCNQPINNKEFWFDPNNYFDQIKRKSLINAFQYKNPRYFIGVTCPKVFGIDTHNQMKTLSGQDKEHITWADIWVNSNYSFFREEIIPLFSQRTVVLFCNRSAKIQNLPFLPYIHFPVDNNAWEKNWNYIEEAKHVFDGLDDNLLVLFCCGPFGNILCHQLTEYNPNNTYLDIGSTLNPYLQSAGFERDYYMGDNFFSNLTGTWGQEE